MNIFKVLTLTLVSVWFAGFINSCSTEKEALINKGYHNMNARYNGYFNAGEIMREALTGYRNSAKEDYTKILPLELYPDADQASGLFPQMDVAIEKCSKVIYKHAMPSPEKVRDKDVEHCKWIDDNWLVIGQSHFVKREYDEAIKKFKYIKKAYTGESSLYSAKIWLAKTYIELEEYSKAKIELDKVTLDVEAAEAAEKSVLDIFKKEKEKSKKKKRRPSKNKRKRLRKEKKKEKKNEPAKFSKKLKVEYEITFASLYIKQEDYAKAATHLEKAIELTSNRQTKARYMFVLGQLLEKSGNSSSAQDFYAKVAKSSAPYEMRFYAKINKALSSTGGSEDLRKDLAKMLRDDKNDEYKDQIYYVLADLDIKDNDMASAKDNLTRSAFYSITNDRQKGMSYLKLADISFDERDYVPAQKYYDSCIAVLPKAYENYEAIAAKAIGLQELVMNYEIVQRQDSLLMIAAMSEKDREKFLEATLKQIKEDKIRKEAEAEARLLAQQKRLNNAAASVGVGSKWYFYNQKQKGNGVNDFRVLWGQRKLEDNWRRSNKESLNDFDDDSDSSLISVEDEGLTVDDLRADLPLTLEKVDSSNVMILDALYNLGIIYKEQLKESGESIDYFTEVVDRNIEHPQVLPAEYQLYLLHKKSGASEKANNYKNLILKNYADSDIAKLLLDPDYLKKKAKQERKALDDYSLVLKNYRYKRYLLVLTDCDEVIKNDSLNTYINKYYLLKAFTISKLNIGGVAAVEKPLRALVSLSPDSEEGIQAKKYLGILDGGDKIVQDDVIKGIDYKKTEKGPHYFVLIFPNDAGDINPVKNKVSNFNTSYFKNDNLNLSNGIIGNDNQTIKVKTFGDETEAMIYVKAFGTKSSENILESTAKDFEYFIVSKQNQILFMKNNDLAGYIKYFKENYK
jgi:tetratricopeptide (TPR) repeat protein